MKSSELPFRDIFHKYLMLAWRIDNLGDGKQYGRRRSEGFMRNRPEGKRE